MNRPPFFYPEHPEFKAHVEYVAGELMEFYDDFRRLTNIEAEYRNRSAQARAECIVRWVGSRPPRFVWLRDLVDAVLFWRRDTNVMFEQGLERWLREAVENAENQTDLEILDEDYALQTDVTSGFKRNLLRELKLDDDNSKA